MAFVTFILFLTLLLICSKFAVYFLQDQLKVGPIQDVRPIKTHQKLLCTKVSFSDLDLYSVQVGLVGTCCLVTKIAMTMVGNIRYNY